MKFRCSLDKKNGINYYGSINSIYIDVDHRFIRRYAVIFDKIHVTLIISCLLDSENHHNYVWTDTA